MRKPKRTRWKKERAWLRQVAKEAHGAADWTPEKLADVEETLRLIMLATLACDESDIGATRFGMEAVGILVDIEGAMQDRELVELEARRAAVTVNF